jgi:arylsulfatase A-like enzyme
MKRPNFLILLTDQQRFDTLAAAGFPWMRTPNLDRLVREGCLFRNACTSSPLCVPARYDLLTGRTGRAHGHFDNAALPFNETLPTLPRLLAAHGWRTAAIGKCHFTPPRALHGYDETLLMEELPERVEDDAYLQSLRDCGLGRLRNIHGIRPLLYHEPQHALAPQEHLGPDWLASRAIQWLEENGASPFLLTLGWIKPHPPWNVPDPLRGIYAATDLPEPLAATRSAPFRPAPDPLYGDFDSPEKRRRIREAYYESITWIDGAMGRVLAALEQRGQLDQTVIIFTSDHGEMLQDKGFYQKALPYESACRIPLVIRAPHFFAPGAVRDDSASLLDLFPTLLDMAEIPAQPFDLEGTSLCSASSSQRTIQFAHCGRGRHRWVMTRTLQHKYIFFFGGGYEYLYDLSADPTEQHNLLDSPNCPQEIFQKLKAEALRREAQSGPLGTVRDGAFVAEALSAEGLGPVGCKYPPWSFGTSQFQQFGDRSPEEEARIFLEEFAAARGEPLTECPTALRSRLMKSYATLWKTDPAKLEALIAPDSGVSTRTGYG